MLPVFICNWWIYCIKNLLISMEKHYFYLPQINPGQKFASMTGDEFYHLGKVLRLNKGDVVYILNGKGLIAGGKIINRDKKSATVEIINSFKKPSLNRKIILLQSVIKGERMEFILEKAVELGVQEIVPVITKNCVVKAITPSKLKRWQKIIIQAMKQSANPWLTQISDPVCFKEAIARYSKGIFSKYILTKEGKNLEYFFKKVFHQTVLLVGPEGDFTEQEVSEAITSGFNPLGLGSMRLRSETAAIAGIILFKYLAT